MDAVVAPEKWVSQDEEVLFIWRDGHRADLSILWRNDYVVFGIGLEPVFVHHEMQCGELVLVCTLEQQLSLLNGSVSDICIINQSFDKFQVDRWRHERKRSPSIKNSINIWASLKPKGIVGLSKITKADALQACGPIEIILDLQPNYVTFTLPFDPVLSKSIEIDKGNLVWVRQIEAKNVNVGNILLLQVFYVERTGLVIELIDWYLAPTHA